MGKFYYAVKRGKTPGIYKDWESCKAQIHGFSGAAFKKFKSQEEAQAFIDGEDAKTEPIVKAPDEETAVAYVDGSFDIKDHSYSYGVVFLTTEGTKEFSKRFPRDEDSVMRNVSGEIRGAMKAMEEAMVAKKTRLILHYDYEGIEAWATKRWKANKPGTIAYRDFVASIEGKLSIEYVKVRAHSGIELNERADDLAKAAVCSHPCERE